MNTLAAARTTGKLLKDALDSTPPGRGGVERSNALSKPVGRKPTGDEQPLAKRRSLPALAKRFMV